jgi:hypothetical protein
LCAGHHRPGWPCARAAGVRPPALTGYEELTDEGSVQLPRGA